MENYKLRVGQSCKFKVVGEIQHYELETPEFEDFQFRKRRRYLVPILDYGNNKQKLLDIPDSAYLRWMQFTKETLESLRQQLPWWRRLLVWLKFARLPEPKLPDFVVEKYDELFRGIKIPQYRIEPYIISGKE